MYSVSLQQLLVLDSFSVPTCKAHQSVVGGPWDHGPPFSERPISYQLWNGAIMFSINIYIYLKYIWLAVVAVCGLWTQSCVPAWRGGPRPPLEHPESIQNPVFSWVGGHGEGPGGLGRPTGVPRGSPMGGPRGSEGWDLGQRRLQGLTWVAARSPMGGLRVPEGQFGSAESRFGNPKGRLGMPWGHDIRN